MRTKVQPVVPPDVPRRLLTVAEYEAMGRADILCEDERVELLGGEIIQMAARGRPHSVCVNLFEIAFRELGDRAAVRFQDSVVLSPRTGTPGAEPEPDIAVLRPPARRYLSDGPNPEDILLVVEVSDTTFRYDRYTKLQWYASAALPEVWIVDLNGMRVLVFRRPRPDELRYEEETVVERDGVLSPLVFPDLQIRVVDILP
jgi:Uma2 family endonuclease